jgi:hypothetical protein
MQRELKLINHCENKITTVAFPFSELKIASTMLGSFSLPHEYISAAVTHSSSVPKQIYLNFDDCSLALK